MDGGAESSDQVELLSQSTDSSLLEDKCRGGAEEFSSEDLLNPDPTGEEDDDDDDEEEGIKIQFDGDADDDDDNGSDNEKEVDDEKELDSDEEEDDFSEDEDLEDEELDESEIDSMLEQGLPQSKRLGKKLENVGEKLMASVKGAELGKEFFIKKIVTLEEKGGNTFEVMPSGWIQVRHSSGMPVYLHRKSRVCCVSKPYYLGPASVRRHSIPISGIPCMAYRRALEKEEKDKELMETQVREFENQEQDEGPTLEKSQTVDLVTKCLNATSGKERSKRCPMSSLETVTENVHQHKRKLGEQEMAGNIKRGRQEIEDFADDVPLDSLNSMEQIASTGVDQIENNVMQQLDPANKMSKMDAPFQQFKRGNKRSDRMGYDAKTLIPLAKVETARENASLYSVSPLDLREYCRSLFKFNEVECRRFKTWSARRRHTKEQKRKQLERPTLPENAQVIKFFDLGSAKGGEEQMAKKFNDYVFNPNGKSSVCILHEFVQHALRKQPTYSFQELENAATPYSATVMINETPYGKGYGSSKKTAKAEAAKATLEILIPQMKGQLNGSKTNPSSDFDITEYFQQVDMSDPRIAKMCTSVSEPSPYSLLLTCLQRSFGKTESSHINFEMLPTDPSKGNPPNQFKMSAGEHSVIVNATNKREGKQLASQLLLSQIHPHITNFGAFLKMYGNGSIKSVKEKKQEEQQITTLQSKASANSPNWAILNKLRQEMLKLTEQDKPGKLSDSDNMEGPSTNQSESDTNTSESPNTSLSQGPA